MDDALSRSIPTLAGVVSAVLLLIALFLIVRQNRFRPSSRSSKATTSKPASKGVPAEGFLSMKAFGSNPLAWQPVPIDLTYDCKAASCQALLELMRSDCVTPERFLRLLIDRVEQVGVTISQSLLIHEVCEGCINDEFKPRPNGV